MPDQYTLADVPRRELAPPTPAGDGRDRPRLQPRARGPRCRAWCLGPGRRRVGLRRHAGGGRALRRGVPRPEAVKRGTASRSSTPGALTSWLTTFPDPDLVLVVLGDHQPHSYVSGRGAGHDVPISVIAQDPEVMRGSPAGAGRTACAPRPTRPCGGWTSSGTGSSTRSVVELAVRRHSLPGEHVVSCRARGPCRRWRC